MENITELQEQWQSMRNITDEERAEYNILLAKQALCKGETHDTTDVSNERRWVE